MSDPRHSPERATNDAVEAHLDRVLDITTENMTAQEINSLSKALFPETHTDVIKILGKERILRPTTIKFSRKLYSLLQPVQDQIAKQASDPQPEIVEMEEAKKQFEDIQLKTLSNVALTLCDFYSPSWEDIREAVAEENLSLVELESIAYTQQELNSANDFLLQPLRIYIKMLQGREIATKNLERQVLQTTFTMRQFASDGTAHLSTSSQPTPADK